jgi:hypothetical protein
MLPPDWPRWPGIVRPAILGIVARIVSAKLHKLTWTFQNPGTRLLSLFRLWPSERYTNIWRLYAKVTHSRHPALR